MAALGVAVGSVAWIAAHVGAVSHADALAQAGAVWSRAVDNRLLGVIGIADPLRSTSPAAVARLTRPVSKW